MLDQAFESLKSYDWGTDRKAIAPIEEAALAAAKDDAARASLETRLADVLTTEVSRDAKDFVCRQLMIVGTAASVPILAELLSNQDLSHMARYALERITAPEAGAALRTALPKLSGALKIGAMSSLGARQDGESVPLLAELLADSDGEIARGAALALGAIRTAQAAKALSSAQPKSAEVKAAIADASFSCAEALLAQGDKLEAMAIYRPYASGDQAKNVRLAATKGMLACTGKGRGS
ncbi:MAG: HEAT repeat domain-containing protein [Pirellulales bacterium]|nr:HEAT repeat domain-containing protein [Pirellulales bacterium]